MHFSGCNLYRQQAALTLGWSRRCNFLYWQQLALTLGWSHRCNFLYWQQLVLTLPHHVGEAPQSWLEWIAHWPGGITISTWDCHILISQYLHQSTGMLLSAWRVCQLHRLRKGNQSLLWLLYYDGVGANARDPWLLVQGSNISPQSHCQEDQLEEIWRISWYLHSVDNRSLLARGDQGYHHLQRVKPVVEALKGDFWQFTNLDPISLLMRQWYPSRVSCTLIHNS